MLWRSSLLLNNVTLCNMCISLYSKFNIISILSIHGHQHSRQHDGRVVKALDLRSNGSISAWVRTPLVLVSRFLSQLYRQLIFNIDMIRNNFRVVPCVFLIVFFSIQSLPKPENIVFVKFIVISSLFNIYGNGCL